MRKLILTLGLIATPLPLSAIAASPVLIPNERMLRDECSFEITGMRQKLDASEAQLARAETQLRTALSQ